MPSPKKSGYSEKYIVRFSTLVLFILLAGSINCTGSASAQDSQIRTYLIRFQPVISRLERDAWLAKMDAQLVTWMPQIGVAEVRFNQQDMVLAASAADMEIIAYIEIDAVVSGDLVVNDPGYADSSQGYGQHLLEAASAWNITKGSSDTVIAIVDSGINPQHPEFTRRIVPGYDFINDDNDPTDDHGHGTHVAGIAAAGLSGIGTVGVCPECKLMPIKVLNKRNGGTWGTVSKGILFATDHGADVINLSLGATITSTTLISSVQYALDHNVVVVAAAGNMASSVPFYPAAVPGVIGVSGTDNKDEYWNISNYGDFVHVSAPGVNIYSTYYDLANTSGYAYMSGTSMASPFVSGLAGLLLSLRPELAIEEVTDFIARSALDLGDAGRDPLYGYGRIDAYHALVAANDGIDPTQQDPAKREGIRTHALYLPAVAIHP